jgi:hypothetical protein
MYTNYLTGGPLTPDHRGRVRFSHEGTRYEVTKTGVVNAYERHSPFGENVMRYNDFDYTNVALLRTMANAIELATTPTCPCSFEIAGMA